MAPNDPKRGNNSLFSKVLLILKRLHIHRWYLVGADFGSMEDIYSCSVCGRTDRVKWQSFGYIHFKFMVELRDNGDTDNNQ